MSADGEVFYGYDLGDLYDRETYDFVGPAWLEANDVEWPDKIAAMRGVVEAPFPSHLFNDRGECDRSHPDYVAWSHYRDKVHALERESPVELTTYGHSHGDRAWRVQVKASVVRATYDCVPLHEAGTAVEAWREQLAAFMRELELPVPDAGPYWYVTSSYG